MILASSERRTLVAYFRMTRHIPIVKVYTQWSGEICTVCLTET